MWWNDLIECWCFLPPRDEKRPQPEGRKDSDTPKSEPEGPKTEPESEGPKSEPESDGPKTELESEGPKSEPEIPEERPRRDSAVSDDPVRCKKPCPFHLTFYRWFTSRFSFFPDCCLGHASCAFSLTAFLCSLVLIFR